MPDWATISTLGTAGATLVLAVALQDPPSTSPSSTTTGVIVDGGHAGVEITGDVVYLTISLRNVGTGIAVLHGWSFRPDRLASAVAHTGLDDFRRLSRDLCVPPGSTGFWQGALRDASDLLFQAAVGAIGARRPGHR